MDDKFLGYEELATLRKLRDNMMKTWGASFFKIPSFSVLLEVDPSVAFIRIQKRGRPQEERLISHKNLQDLARKHHAWFANDLWPTFGERGENRECYYGGYRVKSSDLEEHTVSDILLFVKQFCMDPKKSTMKNCGVVPTSTENIISKFSED